MACEGCTPITTETPSCAHVTIIADTKVNGWFGACQGLEKKEDINDMAACAATCKADLNCTAWRMTNVSSGAPGACFQGSIAHHCRSGGTAPDNIMGGERLQHGEVVVVSENKALQTLGLLKMDEDPDTTGNETLLIQRCKTFCYSDTYCTVWQYGQDGCHIEHIPGHKATGTSNTSDWANSMVAGETIAHMCPPVAATAAAGDDTPWLWIVLGIIAGVLVLGAIIVGLMKTLPGKKGKKAVDEEADADDSDVMSEEETEELLDEE